MCMGIYSCIGVGNFSEVAHFLHRLSCFSTVPLEPHQVHRQAHRRSFPRVNTTLLESWGSTEIQHGDTNVEERGQGVEGWLGGCLQKTLGVQPSWTSIVAARFVTNTLCPGEPATVPQSAAPRCCVRAHTGQ